MTTIFFHPPEFFPPMDFFHGLLNSDVWCVIDHITFSVRTRQNRCRLKKPSGINALSVTVKHPCNKPICTTEIDNTHPWKQIFLKGIEENYGNAPFFYQYYDMIKSYIEPPTALLGTLNTHTTLAIAHVMHHHPDMIRSKNYQQLYSDEKLQEQICQSLHAKPFSKPFVHPVYQQLHDPFTEGLSILDSIMNIGADETRRLLS